MYIIFFITCLLSCTLGAVCGIGGGVIIKPVLDALGVLSVAEISFLSGCTVLAMTAYSVVASSFAKQETVIEWKTSTPLAIGGAIGGVLGSLIFSTAISSYGKASTVGATQSIGLFLLTSGALIYTLRKDRVKSRQIKKPIGCLMIGFFLGLISSFLGIGGGPINLVVLHYFFSMPTKVSAQNSLYIILFSQAASLLQTLVNGAVPEFEPLLCVGMAVCGIIGGVSGRRLNKRINDTTVTKLFVAVMALILFINVWNTYKFLNF